MRQLFGTDGIRGTANQHPLTPDFVLQLGQAVGRLVIAQKHDPALHPTVVVGKDTRLSGAMLESALVAGLNSVGVDVISAGVIPTPAVAFLTRRLNASLGAVISASHNPFPDNGIKFFGPDGCKFDDALEDKIETILLSGDPAPPERPLGGNVGRAGLLDDAAERYIHFALESVDNNSRDLLDNFTIVLDCANGAASTTSEAILRHLGARVIPIHTHPNGVNINAACGCTHPESLQKTVTEEAQKNAASAASSARPASDSSLRLVGIAHDGDADRVLLCDETGAILDGDELMAIAAVHLLEQGALAQNTLVATVMSNWALNELLESRGGKVLRTDVGDRYVLKALRDHDLNFGGEQSGHFIFRDHNTTGDGIISALQFLQIMAKTGKPLSELKRILTKYPQAQRNIPVRERTPVETLTHAQTLIAETESTLGKEGRTLLRYSGTEPLIRLLIEGKDAAYIESRADLIATAITTQIGA